MLDQQTLREKAWIGDAVLSLYAREWLLTYALAKTESRAELFTQFTSNQFLSGLGEPTRIEAEIGLIYEQAGLSAAYQFISDRILPLFLKQLKNRQRGSRHSR